MKPAAGSVFLIAAGLLVAAAIAGGLLILGSPEAARLRRLDEQRIEALRSLSNGVDAYWRSRGALPETLEEMARGEGEITPSRMRDPASGAAYEYRRTGPAAYELCASFQAPAEEDAAVRWRHGRGRTCFAFTPNDGRIPPPPR